VKRFTIVPKALVDPAWSFSWGWLIWDWASRRVISGSTITSKHDARKRARDLNRHAWLLDASRDRA